MSGVRCRSSANHLYFAYGSNMHVHQMAVRCPTSVLVGLGKLRNWRWQINERGVGNIVQSPGDYVEGIVYDIDKGDKRQLDRNEGVSKGFYNDVNLLIQITPHSDYNRQKTVHVASSMENETTQTWQEDFEQGTAAIHPRLQGYAGQASTPAQDRKTQLQTGHHRRSRSPARVIPAAAKYPAFEDSEVELWGENNTLVYISLNYMTDGDIRPEYVKRMERAINDGAKLGLSPQFLNGVERCIHRTQPSSFGASSYQDRSFPSQQEAARLAHFNQDYSSNERNRIERDIHHARDEHPHIVKARPGRFVTSKGHDRVRDSKRSSSSHT